METGKYIFYVHDTLDRWELALASIVRQDFQPMDFVLYNNSRFKNSLIMERAKTLGNKFSDYSVFRTWADDHQVLTDVQCQLQNIDGADYYFMHKADFYLGKNAIGEAQWVCKNPSPSFVNFCKFDLRETISDEQTIELGELTWDEIMKLDGSFDMTPGVLPDDWGIQYDKIGYSGWDGTMHFYNEAARKIIDMDTFTKEKTVSENTWKNHDLSWFYGDTRFLALHMFHELPGGRGDKNKDVPGHRY